MPVSELNRTTQGGHSMLAYTYPLADLFGTMLGFFLLVIWFWLLIIVFSDVFRSHDIGGGAKALWVIFVIILPFLGIFVYLIARGGKMQERAAKQAAQQQEAFDAYVKETAGASSDSTEQLAKLADLKQQGVITDAEFESQKAKILA
jgi:ABC-type multidrug transport system fused ATPase/permease subunit